MNVAESIKAMLLVKVARRLQNRISRAARLISSDTRQSELNGNLDATVNLLDDILDAKLRPRAASASAQREIFDSVAQSLKLSTLGGWYQVTVKQVQQNRKAAHVLNKYHRNSLQVALQAVYPDHPWAPDLFSMRPKGYWKNMEHVRSFFEKLSAKQGFQSLDDWYKLTKASVLAAGGSGLLDAYSGSVYKALTKSFPEHLWLPWKFKNPPKNIWRDLGTRRAFVDSVARQKRLDPTKVDDWLRLGPKDIIESGGGGLLTNYYAGSLPALLKDIYQDLDWPP